MALPGDGISRRGWTGRGGLAPRAGPDSHGSRAALRANGEAPRDGLLAPGSAGGFCAPRRARKKGARNGSLRTEAKGRGRSDGPTRRRHPLLEAVPPEPPLRGPKAAILPPGLAGQAAAAQPP